MKNRTKLILPGLLIICSSAYGQDFAEWNANKLILDNGSVRKEISISGGKLKSEILKISGWNDNYLGKGSKEFSLRINEAESPGE